MHATIDVESEVSRGSVFTVRIPFQIARAEAVPTAEPEQGTTLERIRILLAEDNELNRINRNKTGRYIRIKFVKKFRAAVGGWADRAVSLPSMQRAQTFPCAAAVHSL